MPSGLVISLSFLFHFFFFFLKLEKSYENRDLRVNLIRNNCLNTVVSVACVFLYDKSKF